MNYQLLINNSPFFEGDVYALCLIIFIVFVILIEIILTIWGKLHENEKMKYEFITIIAHKFRTPLTHIKWLIEEIKGKEQDTSKRNELSDLELSADKLINMTGTLIELTNSNNDTKSTYRFEKISLNNLIRDITNSIKKIYQEKNISFSVNYPQEDIWIKVDRMRIEFVLLTLLENSCIYTPPGRNVSVSIGQLGRKAIISISDNGIGIDTKDLTKIFEKFYRAPNAKAMDTEGFGIGLFMAQTVAKHHNGKIEVYSAGTNQGSEFRLILPRVRK